MILLCRKVKFKGGKYKSFYLIVKKGRGLCLWEEAILLLALTKVDCYSGDVGYGDELVAVHVSF